MFTLIMNDACLSFVQLQRELGKVSTKNKYYSALIKYYKY